MLKRDHQLVLPTQARAPGFRVELSGTTFRLIATGAWTVHEAAQLDAALKRLRVPIPPTPDFTGEMDIVSPTVQRATGYPATSLQQFLKSLG